MPVFRQVHVRELRGGWMAEVVGWPRSDRSLFETERRAAYGVQHSRHTDVFTLSARRDVSLHSELFGV